MDRTVNLQVEGMSCQMCVRHVRNALSGLPGARIEDVQIGSARLTVPDQVSQEQILAAVREAGYAPSLAPR